MWHLNVFVFALLGIKMCSGMTYYDYYAPNGEVKVGLVAEGDDFTLNNKTIKILSGTLHYFRVHPDYWRDTLKKFRALGLNAVQTYAPWNLHEPRQGVFDFGDLGEEMSPFLDVRAFIKIAQEEDLFVIFRPGPFICAEWDFGGMPSWLLRDDNLQVRVNYSGFTEPVQKYFNNLLPKVADLQFTRGGPIISVQIENEYSGFANSGVPESKAYLELLKETLTANGFNESLYFTSDSMQYYGATGGIEGVLMTVNLQTDPTKSFGILKAAQPNRPVMVTEYWTGWFDHWLEASHHTTDATAFGSTLETILLQNSSVNMYMLIGGTSFSFMSGANTNAGYSPDVSSYDYDAPISECGDYKDKYDIAKKIIAKHNPLANIVDNPNQPPEREKHAYAKVSLEDSLDFATLLSQQTKTTTNEGPMSMEQLPINDNSGQAHGYVVYQAKANLTPNSKLLIKGHVRDMAQVLVDGVVVTKPYSNPQDLNGFGFWNGNDQELALPGKNAVANVTIMVENLGRVNFGEQKTFLGQKKGIWEGPVFIDGEQIDEWDIYSLELQGKQVSNFTGWEKYTAPLDTPAMYRAYLEINDTPKDTFLDMSQWNKGVVFVNGFNIGRYWKVGPPKTLYLPAALLKTSKFNEIIAFEQYAPATGFTFLDEPNLG